MAIQFLRNQPAIRRAGRWASIPRWAQRLVVASVLNFWLFSFVTGPAAFHSGEIVPREAAEATEYVLRSHSIYYRVAAPVYYAMRVQEMLTIASMLFVFGLLIFYRLMQPPPVLRSGERRGTI